MRIYNGTNSQIDMPLTGTQRITIPAHSVSGDIMASSDFLSLLVSSYDYSELALIVSGPYELNLCAQVSGSVGFVVQSLDEAIERFQPKKEEEEVVMNDEEKPCCVGDKKSEEPVKKEEKAGKKENIKKDDKIEEKKVDSIKVVNEEVKK